MIEHSTYESTPRLRFVIFIKVQKSDEYEILGMCSYKAGTSTSPEAVPSLTNVTSVEAPKKPQEKAGTMLYETTGTVGLE